MVSICISLMIKDVEHIFMSASFICNSSLFSLSFPLTFYFNQPEADSWHFQSST